MSTVAQMPTVSQLERYTADRHRRRLEDAADALRTAAQERERLTAELRAYLVTRTDRESQRRLRSINNEIGRAWDRQLAATVRLNAYNKAHPIISY